MRVIAMHNKILLKSLNQPIPGQHTPVVDGSRKIVVRTGKRLQSLTASRMNLVLEKKRVTPHPAFRRSNTTPDNSKIRMSPKKRESHRNHVHVRPVFIAHKHEQIAWRHFYAI
jgi:hypothetical protein